VISATENLNKFQKTRFSKEKAVGYVATLRPTSQATLVTMKKTMALYGITRKLSFVT
jgi:hypothetical protein